MKYTIHAGLTLVLALAAFGCSSSTDSTLQQGNLTDPEFQAAQPRLEEAIAQAVGSMDWAMDYSFNSPSDTLTPLKQGRSTYSPAAAVDTFSYTWDAVNGWHVAYALFSDTAVSGSVLDSVQFRDAAGAFQQNFDSTTTDYPHVIQQFDVTFTDSLLGQGHASAGFNMTLAGLTGGVVTANGRSTLSLAMTIADTAGTCDLDMSFDETLTDVTFVEPGGPDAGVCPTSGSLQMSGSINLACTGQGGNGTISESWVVDVTFNHDGTMDVAARSGNTVWTYSGNIPCGNYQSPY